jgi:energy-converting hydrogenase Eha subunit G
LEIGFQDRLVLPPKKWNRVDVCLYGAIAGALCGSGYAFYAWHKAAPLTTIEWLAFVGVTAVAGAMLLAAISELWNWIVRGR